MADVKWIKITTDIFDDEKILLIESLPDSYAIITVWFKLLCLAGKQNNSGVFMLGRVPYTDSMLATIFRMKEATVTMALKTFEQFGMVEIIDGVITIPNWGKHQNLDQLESKKAYMRNYMQGYREKQKALTSGEISCKTNSKTNSKANVSSADKEEDIEKDKDKEVLPKGNTRKKPPKSKYGEYGNVLLTDNEYENLANTHGIETRNKAIKFLDEYIEEKGYKSKSHNLAIRRWVFDAVERQKETEKKQGSFNTESFYNKAVERSLGGRAAMEREASERMENKESKTAEEDPFLKERAENLKKLIGG